MWSKEPPKKPGWYWIRLQDGVVETILLCAIDGALWAQGRTIRAKPRKTYKPDGLFCEWWPIPIPPPLSADAGDGEA